MKKIENLEIFDIFILAVIMFATAIYSSTYSFIADFSNTNGMLFTNEFEMSESDKIWLIFEEIFLIFLAFLYLKFRNFNFSSWQFRLGLKDTIFAILMFCITAFFMDAFVYLGYFFTPQNLELIAQDETNIQTLPLQINALNIASSLVNGSFEEIFFIAICFSVRRENLVKILLFSLLVRISFHTYQGLYSAVGIGLILGLFYFFVYQKFGYKNLYAFFLSHAIADVFGLGLVNFFYFEFV